MIPINFVLLRAMRNTKAGILQFDPDIDKTERSQFKRKDSTT